MRNYRSYPNLWPDGSSSKPERVFIGCPHNTLGQLKWWGARICSSVRGCGKRQGWLPTYLFAYKGVVDEFRDDNRDLADEMDRRGVVMTCNCPMMYLSTPLEADELVATNSNKTKVYTTARFFLDHELTHIIVTSELPA